MIRLTKYRVLGVLILLLILALAAGHTINYLSSSAVSGYIEFIPTENISADDPRIIHLTEEDFIRYPSLNMLLRGDNPILSAWIVQNPYDPRNPKPFVTDPEGGAIYFAYREQYVEWNNTIYQAGGERA